MKNESAIRRLERTVAENPKDYESFFKLGLLYLDDEDLQRAIFCLERSLTLSPSFHTARYLLAMIYSRSNGYLYALKEFHNIVDEDGDFCFHEVDMSNIYNIQATMRAWEQYERSESESASKFFTLGFVYYALGNIDRAMIHLQKCLKLNPDFDTINYLIGIALYENGEYQKAGQFWVNDASLRPQYPNTAYYLGMANYKLGKIQQSISCFQRAVQLKPRYVKASYQLAVSYSSQGAYEQAEKTLKQLLSYKTDFAPAFLELGTIYHAQYKMDDAAIEYEKALNADPNMKEAAFKLGELKRSLGKMDEAIRYFLIASEVDPGDSDIYYNIGSIYGQQKKYQESIIEFRKCLSLNANNTYAIYALGESLFNIGEMDEALKTYRRGLLIAPKDNKFRNATGKTLFQLGDLNGAIEEFQQVLLENPRDAYAHYYLGLALFKSGQIPEAANEYKKSVDTNPNSAYGHFCLGAAFSMSKEFESAETEFQKAMELTPNSEEELALYGTLQLLASIGISHAKQGQELEESLLQIRNVYRDTVKALANAIDARDPYTRYHSVRVSRIAKELAIHIRNTISKELISEEEIEVIEIGGLLHDIGKIAIPDYIIRKEAALTDEEFAYMRKHPAEGQRILQDIKFPWDIIPLVRHHHEKINGKGYPDGLVGEDIPLGAMIVCISDVYDALVTDRPYRKGYSTEQAVAIILKGKGTEFAEGLVSAFLEIVTKLPALLSDISQRRD